MMTNVDDRGDHVGGPRVSTSQQWSPGGQFDLTEIEGKIKSSHILEDQLTGVYI